MSDTAQNDWAVVEEALNKAHDMRLSGTEMEAVLAVVARLREFTKITISGLNERIASLEAELDERNEVVVKEEWPRPANLPPT